jgi:hypothetical protein
MPLSGRTHMPMNGPGFGALSWAEADLFSQLARKPPSPRTAARQGPPPQADVSGYAHPSCCIVAASFQIFVIWRILSPSKSMS